MIPPSCAKRRIFLLIIFSLIPLCFTNLLSSYDERIKIESDRIIIGPRYKSEGSKKLDERYTVLDISTFHGVKPIRCDKSEDFCLKWGDFAQFKITSIDDKCENFQFKTSSDDALSAEFNITDLHLYGGSERSYQSWPVEKIPMNEIPFVSHQVDSKAILESYWLDSKGQYLYVDEKVPLFVALNKTALKITARKQAPYIRGEIIFLEYILCTFENAKVAHEDAIKRVLGKPNGVVDFRMVQLPIWTTWAMYKTNISQQVVMSYATDISRHQLPNSQLEIDDKWETCYGSLTVDKNSFLDMKNMVSELKRRGFRVTIWVHPFINIDCEPHFSEAKQEGFFVQRENGSVNTFWWNGEAGHIDFTNPRAVEWYTTRLKNLLAQTGIDSYKFDAGETSWTPQVPHFNEMRDDHPETILKSYIHAVSKFGAMVEVRSARRTQEYPIFVRMMDRESNWNGRLGLRTLIPTLLHCNIIGYPFVLPDMIGGNGYGNDLVTEELFIRWLQVNVFMPSLQFSYPPWQFSGRAVEITKKFIDLHIKYAPKIYDLMNETTKSGKPINLPLWWLDPTDEVAHTIDTEFLLGDDTLVAPVVEQGALSRNIYFPKGTWRDEINPNNAFIKGPTWVHNYKAGLDTLPYFTRVNDNSGANFKSPSFGFLVVAITTRLLFVFNP